MNFVARASPSSRAVLPSVYSNELEQNRRRFSASKGIVSSTSRGLNRSRSRSRSSNESHRTTASEIRNCDEENAIDEEIIDRREAIVKVSSAAMFTLSCFFSEAREAKATYSKSAFDILCPVGDEGTQCRMTALAEDRNKFLNEDEYNSKSDLKKQMKVSATQTGSRNQDLSAYQLDTIALADEMDSVLAMDVYSSLRQGAIKKLQGNANSWSGKYAPGGSSKQASGRSMYNAVNQLLGHFAANGLAPIPSTRIDIVNKNILSARDLISEGR
jgi:hypothetical protein